MNRRNLRDHSEQTLYNLSSSATQPVIYGKVFGWRAFHLSYAGTLISPVQHKTYQGATYEASCTLQNTPRYLKELSSGGIVLVANWHGQIPDVNCGCGLYCYGTLRDLIRNKSGYKIRTHPSIMAQITDGFTLSRYFCIALVSVSGKVILHELGLRAQRITIEKIFVEGKHPARVAAMAAARKRYPTIKFYPVSVMKKMNLPNRWGKVDLQPMEIDRREVPQDEWLKWAGSAEETNKEEK